VVERESEDDGVKEQEILKKEEETGKGVSLNPESESKVVEEKVVVVKVEAAGEKRSIVVESAFE
jgi:hypothetical protein